MGKPRGGTTLLGRLKRFRYDPAMSDDPKHRLGYASPGLPLKPQEPVDPRIRSAKIIGSAIVAAGGAIAMALTSANSQAEVVGGILTLVGFLAFFAFLRI